MQRMHHACPITVLMCAARRPTAGTVPGAASPSLNASYRNEGTVLVAHPKGVAAATVRMGDDSAVGSVSITRTARRLLTGQACL